MFNTFEDIKREYENIRLKNAIAYDDYKSKIYTEYPILKELDSKIVKAYVELGKRKLDGMSTIDIEDELREFTNKRDKYLTDNSIPSDYREIKYDCNKCKDTGYIGDVKCTCFLQKEIELFDNISHFKNYIKDDNFDKLDVSYYKQSGLKIGGMTYSKYMENFIANLKSGIKLMDENAYNMIMIGPTGTGKTFLARCAGAEALKNNKTVLYVNVNEYLNSLKPDYDGVSLKNYAITCDLFILDDLGSEKTTDFSIAELFYIIDKRLNDKKSTILTTNLMLNQIKDNYLSPIYSRISNSYIKGFLAGEDLRGVKNANIK